MGRVVVYDCDGYYVAAGIAELLAGEGYDVHLVTSLPRISPISDESLEGDFLRQHLHDCGIDMTTGVTVTDIQIEGADLVGVVGETEFGDAWRDDAVGVVLVTLQVSDNALYRELVSDQDRLRAAGISAVYAIGDAVVPRMPSEAIFDGHRLARELESDDPMAPKPWLRERPTM
jgi:dimethylamine/trimethylamine dehydrogenase